MINSAIYIETVSGVLRRKFGEIRHAPKLIAAMAGCTPRSVENWMDGSNGPRGPELLRLCQEIPEMFEEINRLVKDRSL